MTGAKRRRDLDGSAWSPAELVAVLQAWDDRRVHEMDLADAEEHGHPVAAEYARQGLAEVDDVHALDALWAATQLVRAMDRRRQELVDAARLAGAGWPEIAVVLGVSAEEARSTYAR